MAPPQPSLLVPGYRLDRYELICPIAQGGMASVWVARLRGKHGFEKLVAIKTILPHYAAEPRFRRMFLDEARIASAIEHVNIGQILDLGEQHGVLYLTMEWIDGDSLAKLERVLDKKGVPLPIGIMLRVLADVLGGLQAAHDLCDARGQHLGVVHRDVSPQNILISSKGVVKLIDFGVAKARDRLADETHSGTFKGKIHYMSPEQALGKPVDHRADLWAIGAMLYRMLAKRPPFEGDNQLATLHLLTSGNPPPPLPSQVPKAVATIVTRALKHDPAGRFASASEMRGAIEDAMRDPALSATTQALEQFVKAHLADRAENRKETIAVALTAAVERERIANLWQSSSDSNSNTSDTPDRQSPAPDASDAPAFDIPLVSWNPGDPASVETVAAGVPTPPAWRRRPAIAVLVGGAILALVSIAIARAGHGKETTEQAEKQALSAPASPTAKSELAPATGPIEAPEIIATTEVSPARSDPPRTLSRATAAPTKSKATPAKGVSTAAPPSGKRIDDGF